MNPAKRDRKITILKRDYNRSQSGAPVEVWLEHATPFAQKVESNGNEILTSLAIRNTVSTIFRIAYVQALNETEFRVAYNNQRYDITHIEEEGRRTSLLLVCTLTAKQ